MHSWKAAISLSWMVLRFSNLGLASNRQGQALSPTGFRCLSPNFEGTILDLDNLYHRLFLPILTKAGIRKIRLHDLRHAFGSLLFQKGASIVYVKEQNGPIQVTVDIYGHLICGADMSFVDRLEDVPPEELKTTQKRSALSVQEGSS